MTGPRFPMRTWLLPEYIEDILPAEAARIEVRRRAVLELFRVHGYELVMPPLIEYTESLLTGTGSDLDLQTFKLVDQISGRMLGLRADITPQAARIDAHLLNRAGVTRLCYAGSVLRTLPDAMGETREPLQIGAEIYGHGGIESDIEIQRLMLDALALGGVGEVHLDLGHVGIFRSLLARARIAGELERDLFRAMQAKDVPAVRTLTRGLRPESRAALIALPELYGETEVLARARRVLPDYPEVQAALRDLAALTRELDHGVHLRCFDLAELRGYHYHTGVVFAAYAEGRPTALAHGGRYDDIGKAFGRARPATGFTINLRALGAPAAGEAPVERILAPHAPRDAALQKKVAALRARGIPVVVELPGHAATRAEAGCSGRLVKREGRWTVVDLAGGRARRRR